MVTVYHDSARAEPAEWPHSASTIGVNTREEVATGVVQSTTMSLEFSSSDDMKTAFQDHSFTRLSLRELLITETELKLIAAAAMIGDRSNPKNGYNTPAAMGTPTEL